LIRIRLNLQIGQIFGHIRSILKRNGPCDLFVFFLSVHMDQNHVWSGSRGFGQQVTRLNKWAKSVGQSNLSKCTVIHKTCHIIFLPRDAMLARYMLSSCLSVCLSVRPSVTRQYCTKRLNVGSWKTPYDSTGTLVFMPKISSKFQRGHPNGSAK